MKDLSLEEAGRWMEAAPPLVQEAITSEVTQQTLEQLGKQYMLHVDVVGLLMKLTSYMLLGYIGPEEFLKELIAAGVSDKDAREIMTEINKKIFVPLREKMESKEQITPEPPTQQTSVPVPPPNTSESGEYFHLENKIPPPVTTPVQKLLDDEKLLEDREEPHIEINKIPLPILPRTAPPPPNLPGAMMPVQPKPISSIPPVPSKPYSTDPYREQIDNNS
jgi:hypothetical protein